MERSERSFNAATTLFFKIFQKTQKIAEMFKNILKFSKIFRNIPNFSRIIQKNPGYTWASIASNFGRSTASTLANFDASEAIQRKKFCYKKACVFDILMGISAKMLILDLNLDTFSIKTCIFWKISYIFRFRW